MTLNKTLTAICIFFVLILSSSVFAQERETEQFKSVELQYSLQYPGSWHLEGDDDFELYSTEDLGEDGVGGAVIAVQVDELEIEDLQEDGNPFQRMMEDLGGEIDFTVGTQRFIGGKEWQSCSFSFEEVKIGKAYCTINGMNIYLIAVGYTDEANENQYSRDIEKIIESFQFSEITYKRIEDDALGISFEYPEHWDIDEQEGMGYMISSDENASSTDDVMVGIAVAVALKEELGGSVEELIDQLRSSGSRIDIGPEQRDIAGYTWIYLEVSEESNKMTVAVREAGDNFIVIATMINPAEYEPEVEEIIMNFFNSLEFYQ